MRYEEETCDHVPLHLDQSGPLKFDLVLPKPAVASLAVAGASRRLRFTFYTNWDQTVAGFVAELRPELAALQIAFPARHVADRVHVQLSKVSMAHEQPGDVIGQFEAA